MQGCFIRGVTRDACDAFRMTTKSCEINFALFSFILLAPIRNEVPHDGVCNEEIACSALLYVALRISAHLLRRRVLMCQDLNEHQLRDQRNSPGSFLRQIFQ